MAEGVATDGLRRDLGTADSVGIGLGAIIGAGIYVVLGLAAEIAGPAVVVSLALAGVVAVANALSAAQLAAEYPRSGGTYEYGYRVLGPWAGYIAGWMFLASKIAAAGTVALGLGAYLEALIPGVSPRVAAVSAVVLFTLLNYLGIRRTSRLNLLIVAASVGVLVLFVAAAVPAVERSSFVPFAPGGLRGVLEGAALIFFAYTGYARVATLGEEVRDPRRTIPRAIAITVGLAIALYLAVALAAVGVAGVAGLGGSADPLRVAAAGTGWPLLPTIVAFGALVAMLGVMLSQILGLSRMVYAMARRGDLPAALGRVHPTHGVPDRAILVVGAVAALVAATGALASVAAAAAFAILLYYGIANVAAWRMPTGAKLYGDVVPAMGFLGCAGLALSLPSEVILRGLVVLAAGLAYRSLSRAVRAG